MTETRPVPAKPLGYAAGGGEAKGGPSPVVRAGATLAIVLALTQVVGLWLGRIYATEVSNLFTYGFGSAVVSRVVNSLALVAGGGMVLGACSCLWFPRRGARGLVIGAVLLAYGPQLVSVVMTAAFVAAPIWARQGWSGAGFVGMVKMVSDLCLPLTLPGVVVYLLSRREGAG